MIKGVLLDFDGTIVDSEPSRFWSTNQVLARFNIAISSEDWDSKYRRIPSVPILQEVLEQHGITSTTPEELYQEAHSLREQYEREHGVPVIEGFLDFYEFMRDQGVTMVICSGGTREHVELVLQRMNLPSLPIISREDYEHPKPSPDCYVGGLHYLKAPAQEVLAFDDAYTGVAAAKRAGCRVVAINSEYEEGIDELSPDWKVHSYKDLDFEWLLE